MGDKKIKNEKSEENILDFLGVATEPKKVSNNTQKVTVFDPLQDENDNAASPGFVKEKLPNYDEINNKNKQIDKGNESVLNVLTGINSKEIKTKNDEFDTGTDPFAEFEETKNEKIKKENKISDDPFADIGGSAFDDPIMSEPIKPKQIKNENIFSTKESKPIQNDIFASNVTATAPLKKQNSDNIILDMFADGAPPDPNLNKKQKKKQKESNPFGDDLSNPFGASIDNIQNANNTKNDDLNPFESLDDPFASTDNVKSDEFMAERDPFAGM